MLDSLQNIFGNKEFKPPDEISAVKDYVRRHYQSRCKITLQRDAVIVTVPNSALAGTIRLEQEELIKKCGLGNKRLVIRTGH